MKLYISFTEECSQDKRKRCIEIEKNNVFVPCKRERIQYNKNY